MNILKDSRAHLHLLYTFIHTTLIMTVVFSSFPFLIRKCWQQHNPCCDFPEVKRNPYCELYWPAQTMGPQATSQRTITDSFTVKCSLLNCSIIAHVLHYTPISSNCLLFLELETESHCIVWTDIPTSNTLWPQEVKMVCCVSGMWGKATCPFRLWMHTLQKVRAYTVYWSVLTKSCFRLYSVLSLCLFS